MAGYYKFVLEFSENYMTKISSVIIAKNEEDNIARCIESQIEVIDEIIVIIDKESSDNTLKIVGSYPGVKYEVTEWQGYAETKKYAISLATNQWILWLDADEELTTELRGELIAWKSSDKRNNVYNIPRRAFFLGKWINYSGWYPGRVERLFNKDVVSFSSNPVHEHLVYSGVAGGLRGDINHYTDPSINHYFQKFNRYTTLAAKEMHEKGKSFKISDLILRPIIIFIKMYILKRGFLDGIHGFILAVFSSAYVFTKYSKLWELYFMRKGEVK
jgi:glycosyltransferase involved in cell wall biosynthesis